MSVLQAMRRQAGLLAIGGAPRGARKPVSIALALSAGWLLVCLVLSIGAEAIVPYDPDAMDLRSRLQPPLGFGGSWAHPLGTDELGRDMLSRLIAALRISLLLALAGSLIGAAIGTTLGFISAHFRGIVDDAVMLLVDAQAALPFFIIALAAVAMLGTGLEILIAVLGLYGWERYARLARALAMSAAEQGYAEAARCLGAGPMRLYLRHILPNVAAPLLVNLTVNFPETVLLESGLSFLGLGVQPPMTSLGAQLGYGRDYLVNAWWVALPAGFMIFVSTLAFSILGDWARDRLDQQS